MKKCAIALTLSLALLLAACGEPDQPPAATPSPTDGVNVTVHWDALTPEPENRAERWYEEYTDELIPSDEYGELVPYIGGEIGLDEYWLRGWVRGLATRDGVIVTDPVYLDVQLLSWYDSGYGSTRTGSAYILRTAVPSDAEPSDEWSPAFEDRYGFAASDGAWYTGQLFSDVIYMGEPGALFMTPEGDAVMVGTDGSEIFRWEAGNMPIDAFEPGQSYWMIDYSDGTYLRFQLVDADGWKGEFCYVDLRTGDISYTRPEDFIEREPYLPWEYQTYGGGEYLVEDGMVHIRSDEYGEHSFPVPEGTGEYPYPDIDGDRVLFGQNDGRSILTDLDGNVLLRAEEYLYWPYPRWSGAPNLPESSEIVETDGESSVLRTVYTRDGEKLLSTGGYVSQWGDRLLIADSDSYRLTDLEGNDLMRLSRYEKLDIPAED